MTKRNENKNKIKDPNISKDNTTSQMHYDQQMQSTPNNNNTGKFPKYAWLKCCCSGEIPNGHHVLKCWNGDFPYDTTLRRGRKFKYNSEKWPKLT